MTSRVTVRRTHREDGRLTFGVRTRTERFTAARVWVVKVDGRDTSLRVVDGSVREHVPFRTLVDGTGTMLTSWNLGASAGDLARQLIRVCSCGLPLQRVYIATPEERANPLDHTVPMGEHVWVHIGSNDRRECVHQEEVSA